MNRYEYNHEAVEAVNGLLDEIGLREHRDRLVVMGGSALAAWGVKPLGETDLDLVVTDDLRCELRDLRVERLVEDRIEKRRIWETDELRAHYLSYLPAPDRVSAFSTPITKHDTLRTPAEVLVAEGIPCGEAGYKYSPLWRILQVKLALAEAPGERDIHQKRRAKHWRDALLIASFALEQSRAE